MRRLRTAVCVLLFVAATSSCSAQETASLKITVTDLSGASIPHAQVQVVNQKTINVMTDQNGNAVIDDLPPGTYLVTAKSRGFVDARVSGIAIVGGMKKEVLLKLEQAPPLISNIQSYDTMEPHRFEKLLAAFHEPDLCRGRIEEHAHSYRFLWIPTFDHPVFMRVDIGGDGNATLQTKALSGAGGYELGRLETAQPRRLVFEEESTLYSTLADMGFWTLPTRVKNPYAIVLDGTTWVIEGVRDGKCHVVTRDASPLAEVFTDYFLGKVGNLQPYSQHGRQ
jgi:hypothetical protein